MRKIDYYQITLHYWPQAVEANVPPQATRLYSVQGPQYYIPHSINFQDKPLRKDLIEAIKQTPWMATAYAEFLNLMELNPFPLVSMGNKSEDQDVIGDDGKCYGRIEVRREWLMAKDMHQFHLQLLITLVERMPLISIFKKTKTVLKKSLWKKPPAMLKRRS